jgi:uncharacterized protein (DUF3084 family)
MTDKLLKMKKIIEEAKQEIAVLTGRKEEMLSRLEKDYGLKNVATAEKFIETETQKLKKDRTKAESKYKKLTEQYNW